MKKRLILAALVMVLLIFAVGCSQNDQGNLEEAAEAAQEGEQSEDAADGTWRGDLAEPSTLEERFSYAFAHLFTKSYKNEGIEFDPEYFALGLKEAVEGTEGYYNQEETNDILVEYQEQVTAKQEAEQSSAAEENLKEAEEFLAANKDRSGIIETDSGLQYEVVEEGEGAVPAEDDVVRVNYRGSFLTGRVFESTYESGQPATFSVGSVIDGWKEGLQLMSVGGTYRFFIHPDLAYGKAGSGPKIGPNKLLIFEVELLDIEE
ncbi:MAG: FKBP-type peptidyl-prolyl cis-trans isomerase [Spirochaetota bacterium]